MKFIFVSNANFCSLNLTIEITEINRFLPKEMIMQLSGGEDYGNFRNPISYL